MQKGVDAVAIGVIAFGLIALIVLYILGNNMMPEPLPSVQMPDVAGVRQQLASPQGGASPMASTPADEMWSPPMMKGSSR